MQIIERAPLFIAGIDRSGIGLIGELLEAHPHIAVSRRTNFWLFYYRRFGDLHQPENFERCLAEMMRYRRIQDLQPQPERLRREFREGEPTYARLFALLQEHNVQRLGKRRWADKSLNSERYADIILTAYPQAKMIHVIRDPRDRYASHFDHRRGGRRELGRLGSGVALWLWSIRLAERNQKKYKGRYKIIQYENLVLDPEAFLRELCEFVGEPYSSRMLLAGTPAQEASVPGVDAEDQLRQIWTTSVGRYRDTLSRREVAFVQLCAGNQMARYGYQPERLQLSGPSWLRYLFLDLPANFTRMLFWHLSSRITGALGRGPSSRRIVRPQKVAPS